jgi:hypothetical protein
MADRFPGIGHRYLVDFGGFKVVLAFASTTSLTYTVVNPNGSSGQVETVEIRVEQIGPLLFLVIWQERDKTTVVHIEDYAANKIIINITNPDLSFVQFHGSFRILDGMTSNMSAATPLSYNHDIKPLFRQRDVICMVRRGVKLDDQAWMCTPANAQRVYDALSSARMPPDGPWPPKQITLFKQWMDAGCNP